MASLTLAMTVMLAAAPAFAACTFGDCGGAVNRKIVFVTFWNNNEGFDAADGICQADAEANGLSGKYMAWLTGSDSSKAPAYRFNIVGTTLPFYLTNGTKVADDWADLTDGTLDANIDRYADATDASGGTAMVSTNTTLTGYQNSATNHCSDWTDDGATVAASLGADNATSSTWTDVGSLNACNVSQELFCFEQDFPCSNPFGANGEVKFSESESILQYCDGGSWMPMYPEHYRANGVTFDGSTTYIKKNSGLTGVADTKKFTTSLWFRRNGGFGSQQYLVYVISVRFSISINAGNKISVYGKTDSGPVVLDIDGSTAITDNNWHHLAISIDLENPSKRFIYLDGAPETLTVNTYTDDTLNVDSNISVGSHTSGGTFFNGDIADLWMDFGSYSDISNSTNLAKFIDSRGKPVYLGPNGERVTGIAPDIFLSGDTATWHTNKGTGGGFTENGALTDAPGDPGGDISTGLVNLWRLDGNGSDSAGSDTLSPTGSPTYTSGKIGQALSTDSSGTQNLQAATSTVADFTTGDFSACLWLKSNASAASFKSIIGKWSNGSGGNYLGWGFQYWDSTKIRLDLSSGVPSSGDYTYVNVATGGALHHLCLVRKTGTFTVWFDGAQVASRTNANNVTSSYNFSIGTWGGLVDDVRIYNRALDPKDIALLVGCTGPNGVEGTMIYNTDEHVMQFCDGKHWLSMAKTAGDGGAGCSNPSADEGVMIFNNDKNVMQYCEGDTWVGVGKTDVCDGTPDPGTECADGTVFAGISPDGNVKMYTTHCDKGQTWNGSACTGSRSNLPYDTGAAVTTVLTGVDDNNTGAANTAALMTIDADDGTAGFQYHRAAQYCSDLVANGHDDWYLPAKNEMIVMAQGYAGIGYFDTLNANWSSTSGGVAAGGAQYAFGVQVIPAKGTALYKSISYPVRCVRKD